jgi:hypothetical protein
MGCFVSCAVKRKTPQKPPDPKLKQIFVILRYVSIPICFLAVALIANGLFGFLHFFNARTGMPVYVMLLGSAIFTASRREYTNLNYALCFLPPFLLLLIFLMGRAS